jgi:hypothetical protein
VNGQQTFSAIKKEKKAFSHKRIACDEPTLAKTAGPKSGGRLLCETG